MEGQSLPQIQKILEHYLKQGGDIQDFVLINKKYSHPTSLRYFTNQEWLWNFNDIVSKDNYNNLLEACFKKDGNIKSANLRGISNDVKELLNHLHNCPFMRITDLNSYNEFVRDVWDKWDPEEKPNQDLYMTFYIDWFKSYPYKEIKKQFNSCFRDGKLIDSSEVTDENKEIHYILTGLGVKTKEDYHQLMPKIREYKSKLKELYPNTFQKEPIKREPTNAPEVKPSKATYDGWNQLQTEMEETSDDEAYENYVNEWNDYQNQLAEDENELDNQFTKEDEEAARVEYLNRPKQAEEDDGYDNVNDVFGDNDFIMDAPDYSITGVSYSEANGIGANLTGKDRVRRNNVAEVVKLFEEHYLNNETRNLIYQFYFRNIGWRTYKLRNIDQLNKFLDDLKNYGSINVNEVNQQASSSYYEEHELPKIQFVDYLRIKPENLVINDNHMVYNSTEGAFFPYKYLPEFKHFKNYYKQCQISDSCTNKSGTVKSMFDLNCFCYAMKMSGKLSEATLNQIIDRCYGTYTKMSEVKEMCTAFDITIKLARYDGKNNHIYRNESIGNGSIVIPMGLIRTSDMKGDHYFYNGEIPISKFFLKHYDDIIKHADYFGLDITKLFKCSKFDKRRNAYCSGGVKNTSFITPFDLLMFTMERNGFKAYTLEETLNMNSNHYRFVVNKEITDLNYHEYNVRRIKNKDRKDKDDLIYYYADFEASTQGFHEPYCVSFVPRCIPNPMHEVDGDAPKAFYKVPIETIYGYNCAKQFLNQLPDKSCVYFHNLAYDGRFLAKYGVVKAIKKQGKIMSMQMVYNGKVIHLRDSYSMISSPLKQFPTMFNSIKYIQKEIYPYNYYTKERVEKNIGVISEAGKYESVPWTKEQYDLFIENINKIPRCRIDKDHFDMQLYCEFYCRQDVRILKAGHMEFKKLVWDALKLNIDHSLTISSLANLYFTKNIYSKIDDLYEYSGHVREFIQRCVKGGRCMTRQNKKWHCTEKLYDYDACSLYPSAVNRLKLATGKPKVIPDEWLGNSMYLLDHSMEEQQLTPTETKFISAFIVDIEITKVGKELAFPIIMKKTKEGNLNCNECCEMTVDNIELEDLIKFQQIEFTIKRGYYWDGPKSDLFSNEMKRIYDLRVQYKKQKNPLQLVLKLLMNSTYGKTIQKPIKTEQVYKYLYRYEKDKKGNVDVIHEAARYNRQHNQIIREYYNVGKNIVCFEVDKGFDNFYVPNFIGVQILSMSKRIMNEVMCLAEDLGIMIYYQDTDSMHIPVDKVPILEDEYYKKYNRVLRGSDMGQFHPDFESDKIKGDLVSVESYFCGKKAYCDKLMNEKGEVDYHLRMKGIPNELLESEYEDPLELYKKLYNGEPYTFNLLKMKPSFEMNKNMTIKTRTQFTRQIKFESK